MNQKRKNYTSSILPVKNLSQLDTFYMNAQTLSWFQQKIRNFPKSSEENIPIFDEQNLYYKLQELCKYLVASI